MRMFRLAFVFAAGAAMLAPLSQQASAADLPAAAAATRTRRMWRSPGRVSISAGMRVALGVTPTGNDTFTYVGDPTVPLNLSSTGLIAGGQAGYNVQRGRFVFGVEADIGYLGISASQSATNLKPPSASDCKHQYSDEANPTSYDIEMCRVDAKYSSSTELYGDLTARLGYLASERTLFYVKGGAALSDADVKAHYDGQNCLSVPVGTPGRCNPAAGVQRSTSPFDVDQQRHACGLDHRSGCRIRFEFLLVLESRIPALRFREHVIQL